MKRICLIVAIILLLGVFAFSAWQLMDILLEYRRGQQTYTEMEQFVSIPETTEPTQPKETQPAATQAQVQPEEEEIIPWPQVDFAALQQVNPDVVGWIYIPETNVNYPIVQGEDNDQYLYRLLTGEYNSSGSIFMDAGVKRDFGGQNTPIYGHNMKNGTMFAGITGYKSQEFYDAHPSAYLVTPEKNYLIHLFSGYVVSVRGDAWDVVFEEEVFPRWLEEIQRKSYFAADVTPNSQDRIVTLSTCTYETDNSRFVVHGILEEYE